MTHAKRLEEMAGWTVPRPGRKQKIFSEDEQTALNAGAKALRIVESYVDKGAPVDLVWVTREEVKELQFLEELQGRESMLIELLRDPDNAPLFEEMVHTTICASQNFPNDITEKNCICGFARWERMVNDKRHSQAHTEGDING